MFFYEKLEHLSKLMKVPLEEHLRQLGYTDLLQLEEKFPEM